MPRQRLRLSCRVYPRGGEDADDAVENVKDPDISPDEDQLDFRPKQPKLPPENKVAVEVNVRPTPDDQVLENDVDAMEVAELEVMRERLPNVLRLEAPTANCYC